MTMHAKQLAQRERFRRTRFEPLEARLVLDGAAIQLTDDLFEARQNGESVLLDVLANDMLDDLA